MINLTIVTQNHAVGAFYFLPPETIKAILMTNLIAINASFIIVCFYIIKRYLVVTHIADKTFMFRFFIIVVRTIFSPKVCIILNHLSFLINDIYLLNVKKLFVLNLVLNLFDWQLTLRTLAFPTFCPFTYTLIAIEMSTTIYGCKIFFESFFKTNRARLFHLKAKLFLKCCWLLFYLNLFSSYTRTFLNLIFWPVRKCKKFILLFFRLDSIKIKSKVRCSYTLVLSS